MRLLVARCGRWLQTVEQEPDGIPPGLDVLTYSRIVSVEGVPTT